MKRISFFSVEPLKSISYRVQNRKGFAENNF